jgi:hypothetical protein
MNIEAKTSKYMLLFRGTKWDKNHSPEEIQEVMNRWTVWMEGLTQQGKIEAGEPLDRYEGRIVSWRNGKTIVDGPFAESKEAVGGYFLLHVDDMKEAVEIAKKCPALEYGLDVEVRPVAERCSHFQRLTEQLVIETASEFR